MHYRFDGAGEPVILLHMAVASSDEFTRVIPLLLPKYRVIAPDFLGAGDSDSPPRPYQISDHVRSVLNLMDRLGIEKANFAGHHMGSIVAAELQITHPERVIKLALSGVGLKPEKNELSAFKEPPDFTSGVEIKKDGSHLLEWWRRTTLWGDYPKDILEERLIEYVKAGPRGEEAHWTAMAYDMKDRFPLITCPTLIITATGDPFYTGAGRLQKSIPGAKINVIENGPIYLDRAMPREFAQAIINFLEQ
jgi:pimeloyl-ACP methyl ester carboxylesterase